MNSVQATVLLAIITISGNVLEIMADVPKINDLASVIEPHLNGTKLVNYTSRYLTKPGDNYAGLVIAITAKVQKPSGEIEELPLVAKLAPTSEDLLKKFPPELTSRMENNVYEFIIPALRLFQLEAGIQENDIFDGFAKYYGSRISLNPNSTKVDHDAVLVLENLQTTGFKAGKRQIPFNMAEIKLILGELAKFQALPIASRLKTQMERKLSEEVSNATNTNATCVNRAKEHDASFLGGPEKEYMFQTLVHNDLWKNNIMLKYDECGRPIKVKFIDFQFVEFNNGIGDIVFLLFSSVEIPVLEYHFHELLHFYYEAFIKSLKSVHVSTDQYSYKGFMEEIKIYALRNVCKSLVATKLMYADNSALPGDFKDVKYGDIQRYSDKNQKVLERMNQIRRIAKNTIQVS